MHELYKYKYSHSQLLTIYLEDIFSLEFTNTSELIASLRIDCSRTSLVPRSLGSVASANDLVIELSLSIVLY